MQQIPIIPPKKIEDDSEYFDPKELKFEYNLEGCNFELDIIQEKLLQFYIRSDRKFRLAWNTNFTFDYFQLIKDKTRLREPLHLSVMGSMRGGKSEAMLTTCCFHQACYHKKFDVKYICGNSTEFLEKVQTFSENELKDRIFLIDESKKNFGTGSYAKNMKVSDINSISAVNNISTIMIDPLGWQGGEHSQYGFRIMGRDFKKRINRLLLYNLTASQSSGLPLGVVYIPLKENILPKEYADKLNKDYLEKKMEWVEKETSGSNDALLNMRKNIAKKYMEDKTFMEIKKKSQRKTYLSSKLGSDYTTKEIEEILNMISMMENGIEF